MEGNLEPRFAQSRDNGNACSFEDTGLTRQGARTLASVWETSLRDARLTAASHYTWGTSGQVRNALGRRLIVGGRAADRRPPPFDDGTEGSRLELLPDVELEPGLAPAQPLHAGERTVPEEAHRREAAIAAHVSRI